MPSRNHDSKVTKRSALPFSRRDSSNRQPSMLRAAQDQLEHVVKVEASLSAAQRDLLPGNAGNDENLASEDTDGVPSPQTLRSAADPSPDLQMLDESESASSSQESSEPALRTAGEVAFDNYGDKLKLANMNAVCRKLAAEVPRREATQRRAQQKLNLERRSNVEALLAHMTGVAPSRPCKNCYKGHGPWTQCIVFPGAMCGSCSNCWFNASGARCSFHESHHSPITRRHGNSDSSSIARAVTAARPTATQSSLPALSQAANIDRWNISDGTRRLIQQTMSDVSAYSKRDRYLARIEAAAEELGMRIAEYEEFLQTPEGMAEQVAASEKIREANGEGENDGLPLDASIDASI